MGAIWYPDILLLLSASSIFDDAVAMVLCLETTKVHRLFECEKINGLRDR